MYDARQSGPDEHPDLETRPPNATSAALRLLALRPRTVAEMTGRLEKRFGKQEAERIAQWLQAKGLLDDAEFAQQWRQSRERRRPRSRGMIEQELKQKGVATPVIEKAMEGFDSTEAAYRAAFKYASRQTRYDRKTFDRRVAAFLNRRGFESEVIRKTLHRLRQEPLFATMETVHSAEDG